MSLKEFKLMLNTVINDKSNEFTEIEAFEFISFIEQNIEDFDDNELNFEEFQKLFKYETIKTETKIRKLNL